MGMLIGKFQVIQIDLFFHENTSNFNKTTEILSKDFEIILLANTILANKYKGNKTCRL